MNLLPYVWVHRSPSLTAFVTKVPSRTGRPLPLPFPRPRTLRSRMAEPPLGVPDLPQSSRTWSAVCVPTHCSFRFQGLKLVKTNPTCQPLWWHSLWQSWSTSSRSGISVSLTRRMSTWEKLREVVFREIGGYLRKQLVLFQIGGFVRPCWGSLQKQHRARSPSWYDQGTPDEVFTCCHTFSPDFAWFNLISPDFLTHHTSSRSLSVPDFTRSCTVTWFLSFDGTWYFLFSPDVTYYDVTTTTCSSWSPVCTTFSWEAPSSHFVIISSFVRQS